MKKTAALPLLALLGGAACFALRLAQNRTGFSPQTGLPVPGSLYARLLVLALAALAAALLLLSRLYAPRLPQGCAFRTALRAGPGAAAPMAAGIGLWLLSAAANMAGPGLSAYPLFSGSHFPPRVQLTLGVLTALAAVSLFPAVSSAASGRLDGERWRMAPPLLLVPPVMLVVRLVLTYRAVSLNPALTAYYPELLALSALALGFFRLASFAYDDGRPRQLALTAGLSLMLCLTVLADRRGLPEAAFFLGGALILLGFLFSLQPQRETC